MNANSAALDARVAPLLREAASWRLLARLFECPAEEWMADIRQLASEVDDEEIRAAAAAVEDADTEGQYHSIFGPGGPAPPREASYRETLELGSLMSEIAGYYDAFGYRTAGVEPPDHLATEIGFVGYLKLKEAYALANHETEHAERAAKAATHFRADHLAYIAEPIARLLEDSHLRYLALAARALASRVGSRPRSSRLPMASPPAAGSSDDPFTCGA